MNAFFSTVYHSYWIRIRRTKDEVVPYRTDDNSDKRLSHENWADFQIQQDEWK